MVGAFGPASMSGEEPEWWEAPRHFLVHTLAGVFVFTVIALAAVLLDLLVRWLESNHTAEFIVWGLKSAEVVVFAVDLVLFLVFIARTALRAWRRL